MLNVKNALLGAAIDRRVLEPYVFFFSWIWPTFSDLQHTAGRQYLPDVFTSFPENPEYKAPIGIVPEHPKISIPIEYIEN